MKVEGSEEGIPEQPLDESLLIAGGFLETYKAYCNYYGCYASPSLMQQILDCWDDQSLVLDLSETPGKIKSFFLLFFIYFLILFFIFYLFFNFVFIFILFLIIFIFFIFYILIFILFLIMFIFYHYFYFYLFFNLYFLKGIESDSGVTLDLKPLSCALYYNQYFRALRVEDVSRKGFITLFCTVFKHNTYLTEIEIANMTHSSGKTMAILGQSLKTNTLNVLQSLSLSGTKIREVSMVHFYYFYYYYFYYYFLFIFI